MEENDSSDPGPPVRIPITDELDLHTFHPRELGVLLPAYFDACLARGLTRVRLVHGKGTGTLRATVHALLQRDPRVSRFHLAGETEGHWGATVAYLKPVTCS